eukprot:TRINITY_DN16583_c0_g1_i2.p1 TRINITY_DN16583_c0_g1~~TRINITY_DN16583_c0_g1_i2.p1  ORF type:complete len:215 (-),score=46.89 TRINITY_DN16583_c0_g1_i2:42-686(-)
MGCLCSNDKGGVGKYLCCGRKLNTASKAQVLAEAQSGDVLLFDQNTIGSSWKCLSRSEWNHVAIVIDTPKGIKFLVEAVAPQVIAWRLDHALDFWLSKESKATNIAWRQLSGIQRGSELTRSVFKFTLEMQGRPYENCFTEMVSAIFNQDRERCCSCLSDKDEYKDVHLYGTESESVPDGATNKLADMPGSGPCLLYTSPSPRDRTRSRMPSSA